MSNSTQNDEIKQMEKAIDEGFAESEKFLKGMKTPFDKPTQNDPIINGEWGSPAPYKVNRWVKKDSTQNDWEKRFENRYFGDFWKMGIPLEPTTPEKERARFKRSLKAFMAQELADARKEVIERIDQAIRTTMDPYEYRGKITAQQAKEQTLILVRQILRATQKEVGV